MFLSKLVLNSRDRHARRDLGSAYEMHRTILSAGFDGVAKEDLGRVLFRAEVDPNGRNPAVVLVQSVREPAWNVLPVGYADRTDTKPFDPKFQVGQRLRFRLRANPTKRVAKKNVLLGEALGGKRVGLFRDHEQLEWFLRKGQAGGFRVPGEWITAKDPETDLPIQLPNFRLDTIPEGRVWNDKAGGWFQAVRFEGVMDVIDPDLFRKLIESGIGSAKGFGFGLLSVAPA